MQRIAAASVNRGARSPSRSRSTRANRNSSRPQSPTATSRSPEPPVPRRRRALRRSPSNASAAPPMARRCDHTREPAVALVFSPEVWVERLHRHLTDHGGASVRQVVLEPALALEEEYDTLVVSHRWPGLTRGLVAAVHERARCVLGVFDRDEPAGRAHLTGLGVDSVIGSDATVSEFVDALHALTPPRSSAAPERRVTHDAASPARMIVVAGAPGAGASEVALGLTAALAARGERVALVDADEVASSSAARLGLAIEPNLR